MDTALLVNRNLVDEECLGVDPGKESAEYDPFKGIARPSLDSLLNRNAKWFEVGCMAGETDGVLAQFIQVHASLLQAQALQRIAARLERPNWIVRLWHFLILEPEGK